MKLEAQKSIEKEGTQVGHLKSGDIVAQSLDDSQEQIRRYIRLTYLSPNFFKWWMSEKLLLSLRLSCLTYQKMNNRFCILKLNMPTQHRHYRKHNDYEAFQNKED